VLSKDQNDLLTQTGPGTPMGRLFRSYWIPALLAEELPEGDGAPVRVQLLSERLLAFRDTNDHYGLVSEFCAHRGASLWFGRNEQCGIRCPYHGWKYDTSGQCIEIPSEPETSGLHAKVKLTAYPLVERGGILWTYMGPTEKRPPFPEWEFLSVRPTQAITTKRLQACNWLQAMEGGIDSSHVSFLHSHDLEAEPIFKGAEGNRYNLSDLRPVFEVAESAGGLHIGARRNAQNGYYYWRITQWVMPSFTMIPPRGKHSVHGHFWIPIDDQQCWAWSYDFHPTRDLTVEEVAAVRDGKGIHVRYVPGTYIPIANKDNDYLLDRAAQKSGKSYCGIEGIGSQDAALQESMGPIADRTKERLVSSDNGIIMARRRLLKAVQDLTADDKIPPGVDISHQRIRSVSITLPISASFQDAIQATTAFQPGTPPLSV
jgi:phthalate 4,5-dioxygenase oxygenase subunit